jgi:hypothetical protein
MIQDVITTKKVLHLSVSAVEQSLGLGLFKLCGCRANAREWAIPLWSPKVTTPNCKPCQFDFAPPYAFFR